MSDGGKRRREEKKAEFEPPEEVYEDGDERTELWRRRLALMVWGAEEELRRREAMRMREEDVEARWRVARTASSRKESSPPTLAEEHGPEGDTAGTWTMHGQTWAMARGGAPPS